MAHVAKWKKEKVEEIKNLINQYPVVALADMTNVPSPQLQKIRGSLRDSVKIIMTKNRLIKLAFDQLKDSKKGIEKLDSHLKGMPSLIFTKDNPFKLSKVLSKNKTKAPAKPGQLAPSDIKVSAGPTPFAPGPIMGELGQLGIKTTIQEGKIHIKDDVILVKEGKVISDKAASLLSKLKIEPMEIGLNLTAAYEDGLIYEKNVLSIDEQTYLNNLQLASSESVNLSVSVCYPTKETIELLIKKGHIEGKALLDFSNIQIPEEITEAKTEQKQEEPSEPKKEEARTTEEKFEEDRKKAQDILNKLQEEKMKNPQHHAYYKKEEQINKGPKVEDLVPKGNI